MLEVLQGLGFWVLWGLVLCGFRVRVLSLRVTSLGCGLACVLGDFGEELGAPWGSRFFRD